MGDGVVDGVKQRHNENISNTRGDILVDFCAQNELRINHTFFQHKLQHKFTFCDNRDNKSVIDYITNRNITPKQVLDVRSLTSANVGSDHPLVLGKLRMITTPERRAPVVETEKFNIESLINESTQKLYETRLKQHIAANSVGEEDSIDEGWTKIKNNIYKAAKEVLGCRRVNAKTQNRGTLRR